MVKPVLLNKKKPSNQSKISSYFKKQNATDNKCKPLNPVVCKQTETTKTEPESEDIPLIVLDDTPTTKALNDSSLDFIEGTPEGDKKTHFFSNVSRIINSPDMIPPTPVPCETNRSRVCLNNKFASIGNKPTVNSIVNLSVFGGKRRADRKTGMSPDAKKINMDVNCKAIAGSIKKNILEDIASPIDSLHNEDRSPSILQPQPFVKPIKISSKRFSSTFGNKSSELLSKKEQNVSTSIETEISKPHDSTRDITPFDIETKSIMNTSNIEKMEIEVSKDNIADVEFDADMVKFLVDNIDKMSPFKCKPSEDQSKWEGIYENERIGEKSFAASEKYSRHLVTYVDRQAACNLVVLTLKSLLNGRNKKCNLSGFWVDSPIKEGDIVNILLVEEHDGVYNITNTQGLLVLNPDVLMSGTSVVAGVFCRRKAILNERFKGVDSGNKLMLLGSLVHEIFQEVVSMKNVNKICSEEFVKKFVLQKDVLVSLYGLQLTEAEIAKEINSFLPAIEKWMNIYIKGSQSCADKDEWNGSVCDVVDIEENFWCPRYGIKGKIDLTVRTKKNGKSKVMPLELKTGKSSYSAEHRGQLTLYSMMTSDRRDDPKAGLLVYLKNLSMKEVPAGENEKKGLIQLRNELISYLYKRLDNKSLPSLPRLPEPLDNERVCRNCPQLLTCSTMLTLQDEVPQSNHSMSTIAPKNVAHLSQIHFDYFRHWCLLLHLETWRDVGNSKNKALWCKDANEREDMGECLATMSLSVDKLVEECGSSQYLHYFSRDTPLYGHLPLKIFIPGDSVIISSINEIALCIGTVTNINENCIAVILDRNLQKYPLWRKKVFRIDKCEFQSTMGIIYTNLITLLDNESIGFKLRQLIIERRSPTFCSGFDKSKVPLMKPILKHLNKSQQRAVLRVLLAEDYLILKGFPGTGKTSTVVCLVRLLVLFGFSVLLTSYTHSAVDTLLLKLKEYEDCQFLRIGRYSKIHSDLRDYSEDGLLKNSKTVEDVATVLNSKPVVATTCLAVSHPIFKRRSFDYCIIDEAAQILQPAALGPLFKCKKFVLVGDSLQLPPIVHNQTAKAQGMSETLLERLDCEAGTICLTQQYRMNKEIQRVANRLTYSGQLECATEAIAEATVTTNDVPPHGPAWLKRVISSDITDSVLFVDTKGSKSEERDSLKHPVNRGEAEIITSIVQALVEGGVARTDIGVITPYRKQVNLLRSSIDSIAINTVDQFQGKDSLVILYSCVKSNTRNEVQNTEILNDERRLNVAITRAKSKLVFVGDRSTLKLYSPFEKLFGILQLNQFVCLGDN